MDIQAVKKIVRILKRVGLSEDMPPEFESMQEMPTRLGTMHDVLQRFLKSESHESMLLHEWKGSESAGKAPELLESLSREYLCGYMLM